MKNNHKITQLTCECDNLAARYWRLEASGREKSYFEWLNEVKKVAKNIETYENSKQKVEKYRIK